MQKVELRDNIITVFHTISDVRHAAVLGVEMVDLAQKQAQQGLPFCVLHDASALDNVGEAYAKEFASYLGTMPPGSHHVAIIPNALHRVLARFASRLAKVDMEVHRDSLRAQNAITEYFAAII